MLTQEQIKLASKLSFNNYNRLLDSKICGCYFCLSIYSPKEVFEFSGGTDTSALCAYCGIDSILPENPEIELTKENLKQLQEYWFSASVKAQQK